MHPLELTSPSPLLFALEPYRAIWDYMAGHAWRPASLPRGDGHPVLVVPGLGLSGVATTELRTRLNTLGYSVYDWELGVSVLPIAGFDQWATLISRHLQEIQAVHGGKVSIIGWSLGGIYARAVARQRPDLVRQVITLGTPFGSTSSFFEGMPFIFEPAIEKLFHDETSEEQLNHPNPVPCVSIYSQLDGVVDWQECMGPESSTQSNIEVKGVSHFGMVHHPEVLGVIAGLLAKEVEPEMMNPA